MRSLQRFILIVAILCISVGCSNLQRQHPLPITTENTAFQVKVRTGGAGMDPIVHSLASRAFGQHLKINLEGPHVGWIEVKFSSLINGILRDDVPSYRLNMYYGDRWYTGPTSLDAADIPAGMIQGSLKDWQETTMTVTIRNSDDREVWTGSCNYHGGKDLSGVYINNAEEAAHLCLGRILKKFRSDYQLEEDMKVIAPASILTIKSVETLKREVSLWKDLGTNLDGELIQIHTDSIMHQSEDTISVLTRVSGKPESDTLYEVTCSRNESRILLKDVDIAISRNIVEWGPFDEGSTPDLIKKALCKKPGAPQPNAAYKSSRIIS